jgi:aminoglycoside phosphotransferase (APT) family kinase protein
MAASNMPVAEVDVDDGLVRALLRDQFPDLAPLPLAVLAHGWDTVVFRLGDDLVVRLPRRTIAAEAFANEQAWLASLAPDLPLPVPVTLRLGAPQDGYPFAWSVCPWIPGDTADVTPPADGPSAASDLGAFLRALHVPAPADAPRNPWRGVPLRDRADRFEEHLAAVAPALDVEPALVEGWWREAVAVPDHAGPPVWVHGDLHPANLLVDGGRLSGVIDFVDLCAGDPATDLAVAWMLFDDPADRDRVLAGHDPAARARARGWAVALGLAIVANAADHPRMHAIGRATLARLAQE